MNSSLHKPKSPLDLRIFNALAEVKAMPTHLKANQRYWLMCLSCYFDQETRSEDHGSYQYPRILGAHLMKSKADIAKELYETKSIVKQNFRTLESSGWIIDAEQTERLKDDPLYASLVDKYLGSMPPKHYAFNISKLCRLLDVKATVESCESWISKEKATPLLDFAQETFSDDFENQTTYDLVTYRPNIISDWSMIGSSESPDTWDDLLSMQTHL